MRPLPPRSSVWGESEEGAGVWVRSPGYDFPWASSSWGGGCRHMESREIGAGGRTYQARWSEAQIWFRSRMTQ